MSVVKYINHSMKVWHQKYLSNDHYLFYYSALTILIFVLIMQLQLIGHKFIILIEYFRYINAQIVVLNWWLIQLKLWTMSTMLIECTFIRMMVDIIIMHWINIIQWLAPDNILYETCSTQQLLLDTSIKVNYILLLMAHLFI